jgi:succinate-semialdehyde dehydrogenase/glutarate-semialdehyde dehydrogenase
MHNFIIEKNYINGQWSEAKNRATFPVKNPADDKVIGYVPDMGAEEVEAAIQAAHHAQPGWAALTAYERGKLIRRLFDLINDNKEELSALMTLENGKPLAESRAEIDYGNSFFDWFAEEGKRAYGQMIPAGQKDRSIHVIKQPVGVCGIITPWNFPAAMITRKIGAAFAAGCTVVVKPDHRTPFSALAMAKLAEEAGFPAGVLNVVTGDAAKIGEILTTHPLVKKISFTGSTNIGRLLMKQSSSTLKHLSFELGGNAPFIVCEDADVDAALDGLITGKVRNSGQTCVAPSRLLVAEKIYHEFMDKLTMTIKNLKIGNGMADHVQVGPLIDEKAVQKMEKIVKDALQKGARLVVGGERHALGGNFYQPTLLGEVPVDALAEQEEIFGPIFAVSAFHTDEECLARANAVEAGLSSYVYTSSLQRMNFYTQGLQAGMIGVNTGIVSFAAAPFGGVKQSGFGREGAQQGLEAYLETKYIAVQN